VKLLVIALFMCPFMSMAQKNDWRLQEIEELQEAGEYFTAIDALNEWLLLEENNVRALYALADSYRRTFQYEKALAQYRKAYYLDEAKDGLAEYYLALMLKYTGNYSDARATFSSFINRWEESGRYPDYLEQARVERAGTEMALEFSGKERFAGDGLNDPVNSPYNDYAPVILHDSLLLITSSRLDRKRQRRDQRFGEAFSDHYLFRINRNTFEPINGSVDILNTKANDGSGTYSAISRTYYFTACGYKVPYCQIYQSVLTDEGFSEPELLPETINRSGSDTKQPGVASSGDTLFFVSDRPGGHGMNDIWMSVRAGTGWGPARNLGPSVNTALNENSPLPILGNMLIFSSDGHQGFGGMDLFLARRLSNGDSTLVNFGKPFNSSRDDMFPGITNSGMYWASNREHGTGGFDIYYSPIPSPLYLTSLVTVLSRNASRGSALGESREIPEQGAAVSAIVNTGEIDFSNLPEDTREQIDRLALGKEAVLPPDLSEAQAEVFIKERRTALAAMERPGGRKPGRKLPVDRNTRLLSV